MLITYPLFCCPPAHPDHDKFPAGCPPMPVVCPSENVILLNAPLKHDIYSPILDYLQPSSAVVHHLIPSFTTFPHAAVSCPAPRCHPPLFAQRKSFSFNVAYHESCSMEILMLHSLKYHPPARPYFFGSKVRDWPHFNASAAQVLLGAHNRTISEEKVGNLVSGWNLSPITPNPTEESHLEQFKFTNVLRPCNVISSESEPSWVNATSLAGNKRCSFALISPNSGNIKAVGELKTPKLQLGENLSSSWLQQQLHRNLEQLLTTNSMATFFQCFSYMSESGTGMGILSNYNETRFFRMEITEHHPIIYMSPLVKVDQKLNGNHPHCLQTYFYTMNMNATEKPLSKKEKLLIPSKRDEMRDVLVKKRIDLKAGRVKGLPSQAGSSSTGHKVRTHSNDYLERLTLNGSVTRVMGECEFVRILGDGMTGTIDECQYKGKRVAVKIGRSEDPSEYDVENGFFHVGNEVGIYKELTEVQGKYVLRMIAGGFENWHTLASNVLVVEKVGDQLVDRGDGVYVGGHKLSHEEAKEIVAKSLEALDAVHACSVVHGDTNIGNVRVEKNNGKFHVWLIDFGLAFQADSEHYRNLDRVSFELNFPTSYFSNWKLITE